MKFLQHPDLCGIDPDSSEASVVRSKIIHAKPSLKEIYQNWYADMAAALPVSISGPVLELGSGGGFLREYIPELLMSEVQPMPGVDLVADGQRLPFKKRTLRAIVMLDVLHHLPRARHFFAEARCCIKPGGKLVMVEPWVTPLSRLIYRHLHQEPFRPEPRGWHFPSGGPLSQANSALPWMIFQRDRKVFDNLFPDWQLQAVVLGKGLLYLLTGGVTYRSLLPEAILPVGRLVERFLQPWAATWALFARIELLRRSTTK